MLQQISRRQILQATAGLALALFLPASAALAEEAPRRKPRPPRRLVIDPGHGGIDPGTIGKQGTEEKTIVLDISQRLAEALGQAQHMERSLTRREDIFIPLKERVKIAQAQRADLFISVHADSAPNANARGLSAYTLSAEATDAFAASIAQQENLADGEGQASAAYQDAELSAILHDLTTRHTHNAAQKAKARLIRGAGKSLRLLENPMRSANFAVLRAPDVPSLLIETGFLSNAADEKLLRTAEHRQKIAEVLAREISRILNAPPFV